MYYYRAAAFDITGRKITETPSVIFHSKTAGQNFYSDLRNASSSELTKYYCVNCRCSAVSMLIRLIRYATSTASVHLPVNSVHAPNDVQLSQYSDTVVLRY